MLLEWISREPSERDLGVTYTPLWMSFLSCAEYLGGWAAFTVSIIVIGLLTAVIGDVASHFGCTVGLQDSVTALSFVAMGTSIPGTLNQTRNLIL